MLEIDFSLVPPPNFGARLARAAHGFSRWPHVAAATCAAAVTLATFVDNEDPMGSSLPLCYKAVPDVEDIETCFAFARLVLKGARSAGADDPIGSVAGGTALISGRWSHSAVEYTLAALEAEDSTAMENVWEVAPTLAIEIDSEERVPYDAAISEPSLGLLSLSAYVMGVSIWDAAVSLAAADLQDPAELPFTPEGVWSPVLAEVAWNSLSWEERHQGDPRGLLIDMLIDLGVTNSTEAVRASRGYGPEMFHVEEVPGSVPDGMVLEDEDDPSVGAYYWRLTDTEDQDFVTFTEAARGADDH